MSIYTSILTGGSSNHENTSESANGVATDFVQEGVVGAITNTSGVAPATGAFAVNAQGTPDMTTAVSAGYAYVTATPSGQASQVLRVYNNASANVTHAANSSGSTKYDWIYISISAANAANPNTAGDNVATLVVSRSSSSSSDDGTPPTYGYPIAKVTVANGASSITNGNITDIRTSTGVIPGDGTVTTDKLADGGVTNAKLSTTAGEPGGAWLDWTPTLTNLSGGTLNHAKYTRVGKTIRFKFSYTLAGAGISGTGVTFTLPVTAVAATADQVLGSAHFIDTGTASYIGLVRQASTTTANMVVINAGGSYAGTSALTSTIPHTWAATDIIQCTGEYEAP